MNSASWTKRSGLLAKMHQLNHIMLLRKYDAIGCKADMLLTDHLIPGIVRQEQFLFMLKPIPLQ